MNDCVKALVILLVVAGGSGAQPPDPEPIRKPHMVVLLTVKDQKSGQREANRAADRLGYALAPDTLRKPLDRRIYVGAIVTLQRVADGRFAVVSYLGDQSDAMKAFGEARKYYADARMLAVESDQRATESWIDMPYYRLGILIVGSYGSYSDALRAAKSFAERYGSPYGSRGMVYDEKRGLIWPDDSKDEMWAGAYAPRRYDDECDVADAKSCVTVERSEAYEGFAPGLYIVVAGVLGRADDKETRLAAAQKIVPDAYVKQTTIYMGCMH